MCSSQCKDNPPPNVVFCQLHLTVLWVQRGNPQAKLQYQMRMAQLWKKHDCNPLKSMGSIFVQVPLFIGFFGALRSFAAAKVRHGLGPVTILDPRTSEKGWQYAACSSAAVESLMLLMQMLAGCCMQSHCCKSWCRCTCRCIHDLSQSQDMSG